MTESETFRLVLVGEHEAPSPKEKGEYIRRIHVNASPVIDQIFRRSMQGHITFDRGAYNSLWDYILGPMALEVTWGRCANCGDPPSQHRDADPDKGLVPCRGCGCVEWKSSNPPEMRKKLSDSFMGLTKMRGLGELDNPIVQSILFSLLDVNETSARALKHYLNIRRRDFTPEELAEFEHGPQHQALPG